MPEARAVVGRTTSGRVQTVDVLGVPISVHTMQETIDLVAAWASARTTTRLVSFTNVHMLTESYRIPGFYGLLSDLDLNCPDGMPLVWLGRRLRRTMSRVSGPDFMEEFCATTSCKGFRHFFYGGKEGVAEKLVERLTNRYPALQVAGFYSPPFRTLTTDEDSTILRSINDSRADLVWVSLGCPKQETWMYEHRNKLDASVVLSVGMAFNVAAGLIRRAPATLRSVGLEWLYRMTQDPVRLTSRYIKSNSAFLYLLATQMNRSRSSANET